MTKTDPLPHVSKPRHTLPHVKTDQGTYFVPRHKWTKTLLLETPEGANPYGHYDPATACIQNYSFTHMNS